MGEIMENRINELMAENEDLKTQLLERKAQDNLCEISKDLNKHLNDENLADFMAELIVLRNKIRDNFMLAYMAEENLSPSQLRCVNETDSAGIVIGFYFEKKSNIILPGQ